MWETTGDALFTEGRVIMDWICFIFSPDDNWWTGVLWIIVMFGLSNKHNLNRSQSDIMAYCCIKNVIEAHSGLVWCGTLALVDLAFKALKWLQGLSSRCWSESSHLCVWCPSGLFESHGSNTTNVNLVTPEKISSSNRRRYETQVSTMTSHLTSWETSFLPHLVALRPVETSQSHTPVCFSLIHNKSQCCFWPNFPLMFHSPSQSNTERVLNQRIWTPAVLCSALLHTMKRFCIMSMRALLCFRSRHDCRTWAATYRTRATTLKCWLWVNDVTSCSQISTVASMHLADAFIQSHLPIFAILNDWHEMCQECSNLHPFTVCISDQTI